MDTENIHHQFILVLNDIDVTDDATVDRIYEAGCDDATLSSREKIVYLDFDREAETFQAAVTSALEDIAKTGIKVVRVEPGDPVTASEIAYRLDKSREYIRLLISGKRGKGNFPAPISGVDRPTQIFSWLEVVKWCYSNGIIENLSEIDTAEYILKTNQTLQKQAVKFLKKTTVAQKKYLQAQVLDITSRTP